MRKLIIAICIVTALTMSAETPDTTAIEVYRPITSSHTIGIPGFSHITNTYLSPLDYKGWSVSLNFDRLQAMKFNPERWIMDLETELEVNRDHNPARNANMWRINLFLQWGMLYRWQFPHAVTLAAGGATSVDVGAIYNQRNGNNPVAAEASWTVDIKAMASWNTRIGRLPLTVVYQTSLPVAGVFFAPDYGELYYEIYLGNDRGLTHFAHWGNFNRWRNMLAVDLHFGSRALRLGYRTSYAAARANHITNRVYTGAFVIGLSGEWMRLNPSRGLSDRARIIHALY